MGTRVKTFDATGVAPGGRLFAGDLNAIQDQYADLSNLLQNLSVGSLAVGESGLQLLRFGAGEARISGKLRTDGILRGLGGVIAGTFTTTQRDTIASGSRPFGLIILNTTTNQYEVNYGSDATPVWRPLGLNGIGAVNAVQFTSEQSSSSSLAFLARASGDAQYRFALRNSGTMEWGAGGGAVRDVNLYRAGADILKTDDRFEADTIRAVTELQIGSDSQQIFTPVGINEISMDGTLRGARLAANVGSEIAGMDWGSFNFTGSAAAQTFVIGHGAGGGEFAVAITDNGSLNAAITNIQPTSVSIRIRHIEDSTSWSGKCYWFVLHTG